MGRYKDLTGQRFGHLTVLAYAGSNKFNAATWTCRCDCGNIITVLGQNLRCGDTRSCGCLKTPSIIGKRFGRLTVLRDSGIRQGRRILYMCQCDCGATTLVSRTDLKTGHTRSCGCLMRETNSKMMYKHGGSHKDRLYDVWEGMKQRCSSPNHVSYKNYGGRGIRVCDEWKNSYPAFRDWAYLNGYDDSAKRNQCMLDRIDVNGDYKPSNCRWATAKEQARNTRRYLKKHNMKGEQHGVQS